MGFERLREKYGTAATGRSVVNRAICDEIPGGAMVLDALRLCRAQAKTASANDPFFQNVYRILQEANQETADAVLGKEWKR